MAGLLVLAGTSSAGARVTRITIQNGPAPVQNGKSFGEVGPYETLTGQAHGELDPQDPHNRIITDLELAPRNARGLVEYTATFTLLKPVHLAHANGVLLYCVPNRGNRISTGVFNVKGESGEEFLMKRGFLLLHSGWQGDLKLGTERIDLPVARNKESITGPALARFVNMLNGTNTLALPPNHETASLDTQRATLLRRSSETGAAIPVAAGDWAFADCAEAAFPGRPDAGKVSVRGGFDSQYVYELRYTAKDPLVLGIGLAATRDIISFFRYEARDAGDTANPIAGSVKHTIGQGVSQAGNFIKTFLNLGFNQDEAGRIVWNGANPHIAGRQLAVNIRFAVPGGAANLYEPGSEGTLWWGDHTDRARGQATASSLLDRSREANCVPKVMETFGSAEFWGLRMSANLVGPMADRDIPLPSTVARYFFPGTPHGSGAGGFDGNITKPAKGFVLPANPNSQAETMRALLVALTDWVTKGIAPPPSAYPRLAEGQLVTPESQAMGFPRIPGLPLPDGLINPFYNYDFGSRFNYRELSGVLTRQPPAIKSVWPQLVPKVNADGNETSGVPSALHQAPLGTYVGWNVHDEGFYRGQSQGFAGGYIPFARTKAERLAKSDPRPSLEERYGDHAGYVMQVRKAVQGLQAGRFLLPEDAARLVQQAEDSNVLK
jgi:hypothetical protein